MRELMSEFKELRLHGMAGAWEELAANGGTGVETSRWLIEHLLQAEHTDRVMRSISYQMHAARFPVHRDLAGFDFAQAKVDEKLIRQLADLSFTGEAHNVVFIGGTGTGKTHLATALGVSGISHWGKRVRFFSTVDLVNALEQEKAAGKAGRIALGLATHGSGDSRRTGLSALQPGRRGLAVSSALEALRAHQCDDHDQSDLRRMAECLWRCQDDHRTARPADASLPYRRDRE